MPIVTNGNGRKLYVLRRISTNEILNRNILYPAAQDDAPIEGLDPDLEYLAIDQDVPPVRDHRLFDLQTQEARVGDTWKISYTTPPRSADARKRAASDVEAQKNSAHITTQEQLKILVLGLGVLFRITNNQSLTTKEQAIKNRIMAHAATFLKNDTRLAQVFAALEAGQDVDIDAGYEPEPTQPTP